VALNWRTVTLKPVPECMCSTSTCTQVLVS
jgi:hypothetical protein